MMMNWGIGCMKRLVWNRDMVRDWTNNEDKYGCNIWLWCHAVSQRDGVNRNQKLPEKTVTWKFTRTTLLRLCLFRISINVLTNAISNYIIHIRITNHKHCLITVHVSTHKTRPGKTLRKLTYILSIEEYTLHDS